MTQSVTSDRDYLEIVSDGDILVGTASSSADAVSPGTVFAGATGGGTTITHNLGTVPLVRAFCETQKDGKLYNTPIWDTSGYLGSGNSIAFMTVSTTTTTKLLINAGSAQSNVPVFYRIYRFGTKGVTSDERIDKIFSKNTDSATVALASSSLSPKKSTTTTAHGQGVQIIWTLEFSLDRTNWYNGGSILFGSPDTASGPPGGPYARYYYVTAYGFCDSTNFYITYVSNYSTAQTIYTRFVLDYKA